MRFFVLPIIDGVIMDGHPVFWVVDAHPLRHHWRWAKQKISSFILILSSNCIILHFIGGIYLSKILLHHFIGFIWIITPFMKINVSIQETKFLEWRLSRAYIPFAYRCVTWYAVFMRVKYTATLRNCWTRYPPRYSNGWAEPLVRASETSGKLNHTHWLRIVCTILDQ